MREIIAFNQSGTKYGRMSLPEVHYLISEEDYIEKALRNTGKLDGITLLINWETKDITCLRNLLA